MSIAVCRATIHTVRKPTRSHCRVGSIFKKRRIALHYTLTDAARIVGISGEQLRKFEVGENRIDFVRAVKLARAFDIEIEDLAKAVLENG